MSKDVSEPTASDLSGVRVTDLIAVFNERWRNISEAVDRLSAKVDHLDTKVETFAEQVARLPTRADLESIARGQIQAEQLNTLQGQPTVRRAQTGLLLAFAGVVVAMLCGVASVVVSIALHFIK